MSRTKAKARRNGSGISKSKKAAAQLSANKSILGSISRPLWWTSQGQRKFFNAFLARLEERDEKLEKSDLDVTSEDAISHMFEQMRLEREVEEILDVCTADGTYYYLVLWKRQFIEKCTWETEENLAKLAEAIEKFYAAFPTKKNGGSGETKVKRDA